MAGNFYFAIVGPSDKPLFEYEFGYHTRKPPKDDQRHLHQFIVHSALDAVDESMWNTTQMNLRVVDRFNDWNVSAFVTAGRTKLMLLHDIKNDDAIRGFFQEVYEIYLKLLLNPFYSPGSKIDWPEFDTRVKQLARRLSG